MVDFTNRVGYAFDSACMGIINTSSLVMDGVLWVGEGSSRVLHRLYSLDGFEKGTKAAIANLRALEFFVPRVNGVFKGCIKTLEAQKDVIYGTLVFSSTADFIKVNEDQEGQVTHYSLQLPKIKKMSVEGKEEDTQDIDWTKLFYGIGNFFETGKFLQKYKVVNFPLCSHLATQFGSTRLYGTNWVLGDIPFINCWCDKPKDFFVALASFNATGLCLAKLRKGYWKIEDYIKFAGSFGKIVLIGFAGYMVKHKYLSALTIIDMVTQNASLLNLVLKDRNLRNHKFPDPIMS